ncbi:MAG: recombination protein RecR [Myxococcales bacterium]|nr:recombination protein RecR [Myxococcales bacterium]
MKSAPPIERLVAALRRLPGIGEKSATRLAFFLLGAPERLVRELAEAIARLKQEIVLCEVCFDLTEASPCPICQSETRDGSLVCVVEEPADLAAIERSEQFSGRYHVLGGVLAPIDGVGPDDLRIGQLEDRVRNGEITEVILATNPTAEGDATAHYIGDRLRETGVKLSRIAYGLPLGGDIEYADHVTIGLSMQHRRGID